jgi:uncharacterized membrane protein YkoI
MKSLLDRFTTKQLGIMLVVLLGAAGLIFAAVRNDSDRTSRSSDDTASLQAEALPTTLTGMKTVEEISAAAAGDLNGAQIIGVELENENGNVQYKVKLSDGRVLIFDAKSGSKVLTNTGVPVENDQPLPATTGITIDRAREIAQVRRPGKSVRKIETEIERGVLVYSVRFTDDGRVDVNAATGAIERAEDKASVDDDNASRDDSGGLSGNGGETGPDSADGPEND